VSLNHDPGFFLSFIVLNLTILQRIPFTQNDFEKKHFFVCKIQHEGDDKKRRTEKQQSNYQWVIIDCSNEHSSINITLVFNKGQNDSLSISASIYNWYIVCYTLFP
jgi:hypothetical protein